MIRFANVHKEYQRTGVALSNVSFVVNKGEFVFLTGPSGAGKSSILKMVYMDELPTRGDVWVSGTRSTGVKRKEIALLRRKLGVVFQDFRLLEDRTVEANIGFALEVIDTPADTHRSMPAVISSISKPVPKSGYCHVPAKCRSRLRSPTPPLPTASIMAAMSSC